MSEENMEVQNSSANEEKEVNSQSADAGEVKETAGRPRIRRHIPVSEKVSPYSDTRAPRENGGDYQPREGGYQQGGYQRREGGYQGGYQRREGGYQQGGYQRREGGYQQQGGYQRREGGYQQGSYQRREGGYQHGGYRQGGYQQREGGYRNDRDGQDEMQFSPREAYNQRTTDNRAGGEGNGGYQNRGFNRYDNGSNYNNYNRRPQGGYQRGPARPYDNNRSEGGYNRADSGYRDGYNSYNNRQGDGRPSYNRFDQNRRPGGGYQRREGGYQGGYQQRRPSRFQPRTSDYDPSAKYSEKKVLRYKEENVDPTQPIRLNKFLSNAGICSRREADKYIQAGLVTVNGNVVTELGSKVLRTDEVKFHEEGVKLEDKIYILLNKPKDFVTTSDDPQDRKTVMDLVKGACPERIYPIGRLDRNTTGVLLLTNDGDMASKLMHPKFLKKKIYHVYLDKSVSAGDLKQIMDGIELEDGVIKADAVEYASETDKKQVGIEIHSGKNRIVRRIFEHLGYRVIKLDRVYFAGLTKKNLRRGEWRFLTEDEVRILRMGAFE